MYFDLEPKRRREDFYDYEDLLASFQDSVRSYKITLVTGLRRYGKTSLILTGLNEMKANYVFVDCGLLGDRPTLRGFIELLANEMYRNSTLRQLLGRLSFIEVGAFGVRVRAKAGVKGGLINLVENLNGMVLVLDEAQILRNTNYRFDQLLAYMYDHADVKVVLSGSEVGLLYRFLRLNDPESPLYGRAVREVRIRPLDRERAMDFLRIGFSQVNMAIDDTLLERAVDELDGVVGWLTLFGYEHYRRGKTLDNVVEEAAQLAAVEVNHALEVHGAARPRFVAVLEAIMLGNSTWSSIRRYVNAKLGPINDTALASILRNLVDMGLVGKVNDEYFINDPMVKRAVAKGLIKP